MLEEVMIQIGVQFEFFFFKGEGVMIQRLRADVRRYASSRGAAKYCCQMYQVAGGLGGAAPPMMLEEVMIQVGVQCNLGGTSSRGGFKEGGRMFEVMIRVGAHLKLVAKCTKWRGGWGGGGFE